MRFTIINQHTNNFGDDIAGISLIDKLEEEFGKDTQIDIIYNSGDNLKIERKNVHHLNDVTLKKIGYVNIGLIIFCGFLGIHPKFKNKSYNLFKSSIMDANSVIVAPGGANIGIYQDWRYLVRLLLVVQLGVRPIFHNNTVGKSASFIFNFLSKYILKRSDLFVREEATLEFLKKKKLFSIRSVDTGFLFKNEKQVDESTIDYIVFVPTKIDSWHPNFKRIDVNKSIRDIVIPSIIKYANQNNFDIVLLPHLNGEIGESDLLNEYLEEFDKYSVEREVRIAKVADAYDYDNCISNSRFVISMRYHGVVMAINNKVPFLSLSYENKMNEVCRYSGMINHNVNLLELQNETVDSIYDFLRTDNFPTENEWNKRLDYLRILASEATSQIKFRNI